MGNRRVVLMAIWLSLCLEMCYCSKELGDAKKTQSWTVWASKLAEGLGPTKLKSQAKTSNQDVIGRTEEAAETTNSAVSDASKFGKAREAMPEAKEVGLNVAIERRINLALENSVDYATGEFDLREMVGQGMDLGRDKAAPSPTPTSTHEASAYSYNQPQLRKLLQAKEKAASKKAKSEYEAAKENLSQAIGDLGPTIRENDIEEL